jgi:hypothetical protein
MGSCYALAAATAAASSSSPDVSRATKPSALYHKLSGNVGAENVTDFYPVSEALIALALHFHFVWMDIASKQFWRNLYTFC